MYGIYFIVILSLCLISWNVEYNNTINSPKPVARSIRFKSKEL